MLPEKLHLQECDLHLSDLTLLQQHYKTYIEIQHLNICTAKPLFPQDSLILIVL